MLICFKFVIRWWWMLITRMSGENVLMLEELNFQQDCILEHQLPLANLQVYTLLHEWKFLWNYDVRILLCLLQYISYIVAIILSLTKGKSKTLVPISCSYFAPKPAINWKPLTVSRKLKKNKSPLGELYTWIGNKGMWHWSADTLVWQLSIDHNMDVKYQVNHRLFLPWNSKLVTWRTERTDGRFCQNLLKFLWRETAPVWLGL